MNNQIAVLRVGQPARRAKVSHSPSGVNQTSCRKRIINNCFRLGPARIKEAYRAEELESERAIKRE